MRNYITATVLITAFYNASGCWLLLLSIFLFFTAITCPALPTTPDNGNAPSCSDSTNFGSSCNFTCSSGYALSSSNPVVCGGDGSSTNGTWSPTEPTCDGE